MVWRPHNARATTVAPAMRHQPRPATVDQLSYFLLLVGYVVRQFRLLEPGGAHPLVAAAAAGARIWGIEARLDQSFPRVARDHRLEFSSGECVHVASFRGHQQHHLRTRQRRQFVRL